MEPKLNIFFTLVYSGNKLGKLISPSPPSPPSSPNEDRRVGGGWVGKFAVEIEVFASHARKERNVTIKVGEFL